MNNNFKDKTSSPRITSREIGAGNFEEIVERLKIVTGASTDKELAIALGNKPGVVYSAKNRQSIPPAWIVETAIKYNVSADWILYGQSALSEKSEEALNFERLELSIETIEEILLETGKKMEPHKKAKMVAAIYDFFSVYKQDETKGKILNLIKLAS